MNAYQKDFFLFIFFLTNLIQFLNCAYRQEAFKIFDKFTLIDLV